METKNLSEFATYCQEHAVHRDLADSVHFAERIANYSVDLARVYGGHGQGMDEWVDEAYRRIIADGEPISIPRLTQAHEILSRFWEHGEAFDKWFKSKVILADPH